VFGSKVSPGPSDTLYLVSLLSDFLLTRVLMVFVSRGCCIGMLMAFRLIRREDLLNCCALEKYYYATSSAVRCYSNRINVLYSTVQYTIAWIFKQLQYMYYTLIQ
jgi:hypothetical protein